MARVKTSEVRVGEVYVDAAGGMIRIVSNHEYDYSMNGQFEATYKIPYDVPEWHESWRLSEVDIVKRILSNYEV